MKKVFLLTLCICLSTGYGYSQYQSRVWSGVDVGTGFGPEQWSPSLLYSQNLSPARLPWAQASAGMRIWRFMANDMDLTAPAGSGLNDVMQLSRASATGISFVLGVNLKLARRVDIGANADLVGFAFGKRRNAIYRLASPTTASDSIRGLNGKQISIAPANANIVPAFMKQNNGQAEAYVRLWFSEQIGIKLGYMWGQVAYRTDAKLNNGQGRFSSTYRMPYAAISFPMYN
jgi:hypothetical protein